MGVLSAISNNISCFDSSWAVYLIANIIQCSSIFFLYPIEPIPSGTFPTWGFKFLLKNRKSTQIPFPLGHYETQLCWANDHPYRIVSTRPDILYSITKCSLCKCSNFSRTSQQIYADLFFLQTNEHCM